MRRVVVFCLTFLPSRVNTKLITKVTFYTCFLDQQSSVSEPPPTFDLQLLLSSPMFDFSDYRLETTPQTGYKSVSLLSPLSQPSPHQPIHSHIAILPNITNWGWLGPLSVLCVTSRPVVCVTCVLGAVSQWGVWCVVICLCTPRPYSDCTAAVHVHIYTISTSLPLTPYYTPTQLSQRVTSERNWYDKHLTSRIFYTDGLGVHKYFKIKKVKATN